MVLLLRSLRRFAEAGFATSRHHQIRFVSHKLIDQKNCLYSVPVTYKIGTGETIKLDAVYQDLDAERSTRATVIAVHGAPGSHGDFRYIASFLKEKNIGLLAVNYPGHGYTANNQNLTWEDSERNAFVQEVVKSLELQNRKLIFMGHSRAGENALQLGSAEENRSNTIGIVILNSSGLRVHKGIRPFYKIAIWIKLAEIKPLRFIVYPLIAFIYNRLGLKVPNGEVAHAALLSLKTFALAKQREYINIVKNNPQINCLFAYSGKDFLMDWDISEEMVQAFGPNMKSLKCETIKDPEGDRKITEEMKSAFQSTHLVGAGFVQETHFLPKFRASFIAEAIDSIVKKTEK